MDTPSLLLASQSPRRRELMTLLGLPFDTASPDVVEEPQADESPDELAARLSEAKAYAAESHCAIVVPYDTIIVACDTTVAFEGHPLGKPRDDDQATKMLRRLRGRAHSVYTSITMLERRTGRAATDVAETQVLMRRYTDDELAAYVASGDPLDKAGAYAIQHAGFQPVAQIRGCHLNVMGLPLCHLTRQLRAWEIDPPQDVPAACQAHIGRQCLVYESILEGR
jgi:MAF protein